MIGELLCDVRASFCEEGPLKVVRAIIPFIKNSSVSNQITKTVSLKSSFTY